MTNLEIGLAGFALLFPLLAIRVPVGAAMLIVGAVGIAMIRPPVVLPVIGGEIFAEGTNYALTILPLFIFMGAIASLSGMSRDLYDAAHAWIGHLKGGLASATIIGCAAFSALSGSSLAAAITMGRVALPEMKRFNYADSLASGTIAAGGTLGILIPPSAGFVIYAILAEVSIGQLFLAGVVPGVVLTLLFILAIRISVSLKPELAHMLATPVPMPERWRALRRASWILSIILLTIGGIYMGVFSAVEAAGIGAFLALLFAGIRGNLSWAILVGATQQTLRSCGGIFFILFGAFVFKTFVAFTGIPFALADWLTASGFSQMTILI